MGALTLARGVTALLSLGTFAHLTRALGPDRFGILSWGLALLLYFSLIVDLGLGVLGTREVARDTSRVRRLAEEILTLRLVLLAVALSGFALIVLLLDKPPLFKYVIAVEGLALVGHAFAFDWVYQGVQRMGIIALRNVTSALLTFVGAILIVRSPDDVVLAAVITTSALLLSNGWMAVTYWREFGPLRLRVEWTAWKRLARPAFPIAASLLMIYVYTTVDQLMLGLLRSDTEVGWYAVSFRILTAALIASDVINQAFLPALSEAYGNPMAMLHRARTFATALFALGLPIAVGGAAMAPEIVVLFAGDDFAPATVSLTLLMINVGLVYIGKAFGDSLIAWDRERAFLWIATAGALLNIALNAILIPAFGLNGAAVATVICGGGVTVGLAVTYYRAFGTLFLPELARTALATAVCVGVPVWLGRAWEWPLLVIVPVCVLLYGGGLVIFRVIRPSTLAVLRRTAPTEST
ncbi:MAG: oligosaccharide flippase family protein [Rhodothermales bacterium]